MTVVANVPRNDALLKLAPGTPEAAVYWRSYVREWTMWNHIRTVASGRRGGLVQAGPHLRPAARRSGARS